MSRPGNEARAGYGIVGRGAGNSSRKGYWRSKWAPSLTTWRLTVHPHPTLSETEGEAAELFLGSATHVMPPRR